MRLIHTLVVAAMLSCATLVAQWPARDVAPQRAAAVTLRDDAQSGRAWLQALEAVQRMRAHAMDAPRLVADDWLSLGPRGFPCERGSSFRCAGAILVTAAHPTDPDVLYVGAPEGGLWKTTDGGRSWQPLIDGLSNIATRAVMLDPVAPEIVYAATTTHLIRSIDGGASWAVLSALADLDPEPDLTQVQIVVPRATAGSRTRSVVYLRFLKSIFRSDDSGERLRLFYDAVSQTTLGFEVDPTDSRRMWISNGMPVAVSLSEDDGRHWTQRELSLGGGFAANLSGGLVVVGPAGRTQYYLGLKSNPTRPFLVKTTDGWATASVMSTPDIGESRATYATSYPNSVSMTVNPAKQDVVCLGGERVYCSTDGASTWAPAHLPEPNVTSVRFDAAGRLVVGTASGVFRLSQDLQTWIDLNGDLAVTQFYGVSPHPTVPTVIAGGAEGVGTLVHTGPAGWNVVLDGSGGDTLVDADTGLSVFATRDELRSTAFYRCDGPACQKKSAGLNLDDYAPHAPATQDSSRPPVLYLGLRQLYRSEDRGDSWQVILDSYMTDRCVATTPTRMFCGRANNVQAIAIAPSDSGVVYAGSGGGVVWTSTDRGATWRDISPGCQRTDGCGGVLPVAYVRAIAVDPVDPGTAYVAVGGPDDWPRVPGKVFRCRRGAPPWEDISAGLPGLPVNALAIDPTTSPITVYVGTAAGVFRRRDESAGWQYFNAGIPPVAVTDLQYNPTTNTMLAATFGRGLYVIAPRFLKD